MEKYYVSGCIEIEGTVGHTEDEDAEFFTLYERKENGLSHALLDCVDRLSADAAMAVYVGRDAHLVAEMVWEKTMMETIGEDGVGSVKAAFEKLQSERDALQEQVRALAALAEERRVFIINGAEMGYIQLPVFDDDPATATYQRCLLKPKFAADAAIRDIQSKARAEGIHFVANRMLAAWESGFIDDTPAMAYDISGAVLSAIEFLPNADEAEFKRDYADEVRARIRAGEQP